MPKKLNHAHRLKLHVYPKTQTRVFFCILPDCGFKIEVPLSVGTRALCHQCEAEFIINEKHLRSHRPHCDDCGRMKIKDPSGRIRYINKRTMTTDVSDLASESLEDLKSRLSSLTPSSEDI